MGLTRINIPVLLVVMALVATLVACSGPGEDRPGSVVVDPESETVSVSGTGTGTSTGTGGTAPSVGMGGYEPVSNVSPHAWVSEDIKQINELLSSTPYDYQTIKAIYEQGGRSVNTDGSVRTLAGFARNAQRSEPIWDDYTIYYGDDTWLDTFVMAAIEGTGPFAGEPDAVRRQGIQKGIQNQVMVAWMFHELVAAMEKAEDGNFDPASGAPHNWDEGWAFYHGSAPDHAPYSTANKRGENFGIGTAVNDAILTAMNQGRDALVAGDAAAARENYNEVLRQVQITYIQAAIRYAHQMSESLEAGDSDSARVQQAEGWAFFRVIEPLIARADADVAGRVAGYLNLANPPSDADPAVREALESVYQELGIRPEEVGSLPGAEIGSVSGTGNYLPVRNIAAVEDGELENHYKLGMRTRMVE